MSQKKFFLVNMKFSCLFSRFVGNSLKSWHLEQRINTGGAFRIFCHANRFKKYVAALTSTKGTDRRLGMISRGLEKIACRACGSQFTCPACDSQVTYPACHSQFTCPACDSQFT